MVLPGWSADEIEFYIDIFLFLLSCVSHWWTRSLLWRLHLLGVVRFGTVGCHPKSSSSVWRLLGQQNVREVALYKCKYLNFRGLRGTEVPYILRRIILGGLARLVLLKFDVNRRQSDGGGNPASGKESTSTGSSMPAVISAPSDLLVNSSGSLSTAATELVNCNCSSSSRNNVHRKGRPKVVVSATTASGWSVMRHNFL